MRFTEDEPGLKPESCQLCLEHKDVVTFSSTIAIGYVNNTYGLHLLLEIYHLCGEHL